LKTPKFEHIDGTLCIMLEQPIPLTKDETFPCVVKRKTINDDCIMHIIKKITAYGNIIDCNEYKCLAPQYESYEILGYPVQEGSKEWALWSLQQGNKIYNVILGIGDIFHWNIEYQCPECKQRLFLDRQFYDDFMLSGLATGWQLYEPKPQPSEVIVHISLSGTVKPCNDGEEPWAFVLRTKKDAVIIPFAMLDPDTRSLVEKLLKVQEKE